MTELYLNGYPVVLDKSASIKVVFDNPYFTKSSTYTHNISLPLADCRQNQLVFHHIDRADVAKRTQTFKAILISDNKVLVNGTAVVTEISDAKVQVQLLAGNSEMNFFTSAEKKYINEMSLGLGFYPPNHFIPSTGTDIYFAEYPKNLHVWFPVYNESAEEVYNNIVVNYISINEVDVESYGNYDTKLFKWCVQPYLCTIIGNIIKEIGYTLIENQIENSIFKNLFICNAIVTYSYAETLPHWTVNEFFNELEKFLGVIILVNEGDKTIRILFSSNFYESNNCIYLDNVLDEFSAKIDKEETTSVTNGNVGYSLSGSESNKYKKIDPEIMKKATMITCDSYSDMQNKYNGISQDNRDGSVFVANTKHYMDYNDGTNHKLKEINHFRDLINNSDKQDLDVELKIVPVAMCQGIVNVYGAGSIIDSNIIWSGTTALPSLKGRIYDYPVDISHVVIQNEIEGNGLEEKYVPDIIQLAFNDGKHRPVFGPDGKSHVYPMPFTDYSEDASGYVYPFPAWSLRFVDRPDAKCIGSEIYSRMKKVNTTVEETKKFISDKIYDPKEMFIIHNKKYVCKNIEIEANLTGIVPLQQAIMYELLE